LAAELARIVNRLRRLVNPAIQGVKPNLGKIPLRTTNQRLSANSRILSSHVNAVDAAQGMVLGSPFRAEIERRDPSALDRALHAVTQALARWDGKDAAMSAHVATARK
jgi:hypothetical protein